MAANAFDEQVSGIAALDHRLSRQAYLLVGERGWVSRDEAADQLGVGRSVAAFHLDKLVAAGLLTVRFERVSGRSGPGAGRPAKLYGRSDREFDVSLPPRQYDLAGSLLAGAITRAETQGIAVEKAVREVAREVGQQIGTASAQQPSTVEIDVLAAQGYEPQAQSAQIALTNCPFHRLAAEHRALVCNMNLEFISGLLAGLGRAQFTARLAPEAGFCCVRLVPATDG